MSLFFAFSATWMTGRFSAPEDKQKVIIPNFSSLIRPTVLLAVVFWPMVYFLFGYYVAWQFPEIREYYTGSTTMDSLLVMMKENILSGLYFFQILRGVLWVGIAVLVFSSTSRSWAQNGLILGLLLPCLGSSQLLLPNPIMPEMVRLGHLLETSTSNFLWGFILSWFLTKHFAAKDQGAKISNFDNQTAS